jgi:enoyl-CoA hydratase/carnithine racemase
MADVNVRRVGEVDVVTIDRPDVRNALRFQSYDELEAAIRTTTARCIVITGTDPAFWCA